MGKRWRIQPHDLDRVASLERSAKISPIVAQLLVGRGIYDAPMAQRFLAARLSDLREPELLPGVTEAAQRIHAAIEARRRIVIYSDYDADGMTATAVLYSCLRMLGANVGYYVPNRVDEGYGLNNRAMEKLAERGTSLVISVDCGIASVGPAQRARELGLELIVTDHHEFGAELPAADVLVHPRLPGSNYPFGGLCGAGVAFKLAWAVCQQASDAKRVGDRMKNFLMTAISFAALGTVADVVPLLDENRVLVRHGLKSLRQYPSPGLSALMEITQLDKKEYLSSEDLAFSLAPHLNAAGRLEQAQLGIELLVTDDEARARSLAEYLHELNKNRGTLERSIYLAATSQVKERFDPTHDAALVLAESGWHPGVIGIVAGRLAEKYHRPVVMIALDQTGNRPGSGSCRSACGLNLHEALAACSDHLKSHGGHAAAAGLKIDPAQVEAFRMGFCEYASNEIAQDQLIPEIRIDAEASLSQLTLSTVRQIEQLAPFGQGNPRPTLCATGVTLADAPKKMGGGDRHLSLRLRQQNVTLRAVAFGKAEWAEELAKLDGPIDIAYRPVINVFRGRQSVELHLDDWRTTNDSSAVVDTAESTA